MNQKYVISKEDMEMVKEIRDLIVEEVEKINPRENVIWFYLNDKMVSSITTRNLHSYDWFMTCLAYREFNIGICVYKKFVEE